MRADQPIDKPRAPRKIPVLRVGISPTSYEEVVSLCRQWIALRRTWLLQEAPAGSAPPARYICLTSVHGIMAARADAAVLRILNAADIATPDGMPVVWALRSLGVKNQQRVYGPTLMLRLCEEAAKTGFRLFLFGGRSEALSGLERNLKARWPLLDICGTYSPPFRPLNPGEQREICERILSSGADLIFVGISTPKQEFWMWENRNSFPGVVMIGVGAAFDFHSGRVKQAPAWMQQCGLEWAFRLGMEPRRLWKRYLLVTPLFLPLWAGQKVGLVEGGVSPENDACEVTRFEGGSVPIGEKSRPCGEAKSVTTATTPGCRS